MSQHQRELMRLTSVVKSRRIRSARGVAAGSGTVVFFQRLAAREGWEPTSDDHHGDLHLYRLTVREAIKGLPS